MNLRITIGEARRMGLIPTNAGRPAGRPQARSASARRRGCAAPDYPPAYPRSGPLLSRAVLELELPPTQLSPNRGLGGVVRSRYKGDYQALCRQRIRLHPPGYFAAPVRIVFDWFMARGPHGSSQGYYYPRDADNATASLKGLIDALVAEGLLPDDNDKIVRGYEHRFHRTQEAHKGALALRVTIETEPAEESL